MQKRKLALLKKEHEENNSRMLSKEVNMFTSASKILLFATLASVLIDRTLMTLLLVAFLRSLNMNHKIVEFLIEAQPKRSAQINNNKRGRSDKKSECELEHK